MDYHYGIGKIYTAADIEKAKMSPILGKRILLKICWENWNLLSPLKIDTAIETGNNLESIPTQHCQSIVHVE